MGANDIALTAPTSGLPNSVITVGLRAPTATAARLTMCPCAVDQSAKVVAFEVQAPGVFRAEVALSEQACTQRYTVETFDGAQPVWRHDDAVDVRGAPTKKLPRVWSDASLMTWLAVSGGLAISFGLSVHAHSAFVERFPGTLGVVDRAPPSGVALGTESRTLSHVVVALATTWLLTGLTTIVLGLLTDFER